MEKFSLLFKKNFLNYLMKKFHELKKIAKDLDKNMNSNEL